MIYFNSRFPEDTSKIILTEILSPFVNPIDLPLTQLEIVPRASLYKSRQIVVFHRRKCATMKFVNMLSKCRQTISLFRRNSALMLLTLALLITPALHASWSVKSTGTATGIGSPSCAAASTDHVVCAALSGQSAVMVNEFNGSAWGTWKSLAGTIVSNPTCTSDGSGKVFCAATATSGAMEVSILTGTTWSTPVDVAGALYSAPSCAEYLAGEVLCMARNAAGGLAWSLYSGGKWSAFANLSTTAVSAPSCTSDHNSGVICAFFTLNGETLVDRFAGGSWKGFINIGGLGGGVPDCTFWKPNGEVACFAKATNDGIYVSTFTGGTWTASNWSTYSALGGDENDNASCTSQASDELVCTVVGPAVNNQLFANVYSGTSWSGWTAVSGKGLGSPSCAPLTTGKAVCLMTGTNNEFTGFVGP